MIEYKVTHKENNQTWLWTATELLDVVNADRSHNWIDYDLQDLKEHPDQVFAWLPELNIKETA